MSLQDLIASAGDRLTPTDRRLAGAVLEDPTLLAFGTVSDLAERVGTSRPSVVRFATRLGFGGFVELQAVVREDVARRLGRPSERIRRADEDAADVRGVLDRAVRDACAALDRDRLARLAEPIVGAARVWVLSGETSMAGAHVLSSGLAMVRPDVHLVPEHAVGRQLSSASPADVAVVFDFARYRRHAITAARALHDLRVTIVAITDGPFSPLAALTDRWCELPIPAVGPFDSSVPAVTAAELLVSEVVTRLGDDARERIDRLEAMWARTGTFLDE